MLHNELVTWCSIERQLSSLQLSGSSISISGRTVADDDGVECPVQSVDWSVYRIQFSFCHQLFTVNSQAIDEGSPSLSLSVSISLSLHPCPIATVLWLWSTKWPDKQLFNFNTRNMFTQFSRLLHSLPDALLLLLLLLLLLMFVLFTRLIINVFLKCWTSSKQCCIACGRGQAASQPVCNELDPCPFGGGGANLLATLQFASTVAIGELECSTSWASEPVCSAETELETEVSRKTWKMQRRRWLLKMLPGKLVKIRKIPNNNNHNNNKKSNNN